MAVNLARLPTGGVKAVNGHLVLAVWTPAEWSEIVAAVSVYGSQDAAAVNFVRLFHTGELSDTPPFLKRAINQAEPEDA